MPGQSRELSDLVAGLDDPEFERLYGPLARLRPTEVAPLFDGFAAPWWIVGGWAIEAFSGRQREHDDLDICVLSRDVPALVEQFGDTHDVWATGGGMLCPVLSPDQRLPGWVHQIWIRERATEPWLVDIIITPDRDGRWVFARDQEVDEDLADVTWRADDGLLYQRPEVTLAFKAAHCRAKDTADLDAAAPRLSAPARRWLIETVARLHPGHGWLDRLAGSGGSDESSPS